jgi:uncharacterized protein (TIGR03032 family)
VTEREFDLNSVHSDNLPKILHGLNLSLALTSYQSSALILVRSDGETLDTRFVDLPRPMGIYADRQRLTLGTWSQVLDFRRNDIILGQLQSGRWENHANFSRKIVLTPDEEAQREQAREARRKEFEAYKKADSLYIPRSAHVTGMINIHDIAWGDAGLWVVNSTYSCLCTLDANRSFVPRWKPTFISELAPEDRCHLNGMALRDGRPKYVTTFNREDRKDSWTDEPVRDGTLIDVDSNEILLEGLIMPHSPRYYRGQVYLCESGHGRLLRLDPASGECETLATLPGYTRAINFFGPLMFVGLSRVRSSDIKDPIPLAKQPTPTECGLRVFNLETMQEIAHLAFTGEVDQLYDIAVIPEAAWPELIEFDHPRMRQVFDFPDIEH